MKKKIILNSLYKLYFNETLQKLNWHRKFNKWIKHVEKFNNRRSAMSYDELKNAVESNVKINSMKDLFNG
tara:strand:- start:432 stop:641 length:210 start_codon:yes stop_codon:yes gene_type:complete